MDRAGLVFESRSRHRSRCLKFCRPDTTEAVKIAFEVGNRHFPLAMQENKILVPDDTAMVRLMDRLGAPWERRQAVFNPIGNTQGHQHG